jgi:hypothetical protein
MHFHFIFRCGRKQENSPHCMEFIKIAYCISIPVLLLIIWISRSIWNQYAVNVLAVTNILLIGNSIFLVWQLMGFYLLSKQFSFGRTYQFDFMDISFFRLLLVMIIPFASLFPDFRKSKAFSITLLLFVYWNFPFSTWNTYDLLFKIAGYLCLFCSAYALAWLLNKLPFQSSIS